MYIVPPKAIWRANFINPSRHYYQHCSV
jgi:hypothetical protein